MKPTNTTTLDKKLDNLKKDQELVLLKIKSEEEKLKTNNRELSGLTDLDITQGIRDVKKQTYVNIENICKLEEEIYNLKKKPKSTPTVKKTKGLFD